MLIVALADDCSFFISPIIWSLNTHIKSIRQSYFICICIQVLQYKGCIGEHDGHWDYQILKLIGDGQV